MVAEDTKNGIFIHDKGALQKLLRHFGTDWSSPSAIPLLRWFGGMFHDSAEIWDNESYQKLVRCVVYLANTSGPDIAYATQFLEC